MEDYGSSVNEVNEVSCSSNVRCYLVTMSVCVQCVQVHTWNQISDSCPTSPMCVPVTVKVHAASPCHVLTASPCPFACSPSGQHMDHYVLLPTCLVLCVTAA